MRLLDCGCGPGSITVGPGRRSSRPARSSASTSPRSNSPRARALAARRGVGNVRFEGGDAYALPFPDASFDAAFAHNAPGAPARPAARPARAAARAAAGRRGRHRSTTTGARTCSNRPPRCGSGRSSWCCGWWSTTAATSYCARHHRRLLREAGFARAEGHAVAGVLRHAGGDAAARRRSRPADPRPGVGGDGAGAGLGGPGGRWRRWSADVVAWGEEPDAYWAMMDPAALGWVGEERA